MDSSLIFSVQCLKSHTQSMYTCSVPLHRAENDNDVQGAAGDTEILCEDCWVERCLSHHSTPLCNDFDCTSCGIIPAREYKHFLASYCDECWKDLQKKHALAQMKIPFLSEDFNEIVESKLYLGSRFSSCSYDSLVNHEVTSILVCGVSLPMYFKGRRGEQIRYHRLPIEDSVEESILSVLKDGVLFIDKNIKQGRKVLVHCEAGVSRSASLVIAWLMFSQKWTYQQALDYTKGKRDIIYPNFRFEQDLKLWYKSGMKL
jgi:protein tyrosine phosphatase